MREESHQGMSPSPTGSVMGNPLEHFEQIQLATRKKPNSKKPSSSMCNWKTKKLAIDSTIDLTDNQIAKST